MTEDEIPELVGPNTPEPTTPDPQSPNVELACIILPAGTGKSYVMSMFHPDWLIEQDAICPPRATPLLDILRTVARRTGDWRGFDYEMAKEIRSRLKEKTVLMVASRELAEALEAVILGTLVLEYEVWEQNIISRGDDVAKHLPNYLSAFEEPGVHVYSDMFLLFSKVMSLAVGWYSPFMITNIEREIVTSPRSFLHNPPRQ